MTKFLINLFMPALLFLLPQDEWQTVQLADGASVAMPGSAQRTDFAATAWKLQYVAEDSTKVGAVINDHSATGVSEETLVSIPEQLRKMQEGSKSRVESRGEKILSATEGSYNNRMFVQLTSSFTKNGQKYFHYWRLMLYKSVSIELFYYSGTKGMDENVKDKFFNSLQLK